MPAVTVTIDVGRSVMIAIAVMVGQALALGFFIGAGRRDKDE